MLYSYDEENNLENDINLISKKIERTRFKLNKLVEEKYENMIDSEVVELSQKLDKLLLKYVRLNRKAS